MSVLIHYLGSVARTSWLLPASRRQLKGSRQDCAGACTHRCMSPMHLCLDGCSSITGEESMCAGDALKQGQGAAGGRQGR